MERSRATLVFGSPKETGRESFYKPKEKILIKTYYPDAKILNWSGRGMARAEVRCNDWE